MTDTWTARDLPVLIAAAEHLDRHPGSPLLPQTIAEQLDGHTTEDVGRAFAALIPTYLHGQKSTDYEDMLDVIASDLTDEGRRAAGLWPDRASHLAALVAALDGAADNTDDEDERTRLQRLRDALSGAPKRITEAAIAGVIAGQWGG